MRQPFRSSCLHTSGKVEHRIALSPTPIGCLHTSKVSTEKTAIVSLDDKIEAKKTLVSRCSPCCVASVMKQLGSDTGREKNNRGQNMGFGWLQYVPEWAVNQDMMVALASSYSQDEKSLIVGTRKISISIQSIARFKIPETPAEHQLVNSFTGKTQADLKMDVITYLMQSNADRINFQRQFIMLIAKCLFFSSPKATVSDIHIRAAIDVSNPRKIYWARYIYDFLIEGVLRFQDVGKKTVDGCMFALLIIYLHAKKNGDLGRYNGRELWIRDWSLADLKKMDEEESTSHSGLLNLIGKMSGLPKKHNRVLKRECIRKKRKSNRKTRKEAPTVDENETDILAGLASPAKFDEHSSKKRQFNDFSVLL
ncbi:uncharacterized protein DS421_11g345800 [Arachis hypogaea]|nr:uncharacterized protein DS421_11g345800 [Arachis hypogaea]